MLTASFIGNLGQDAKLFTGKNAREMMGFSVGVSQNRDLGTQWIDVTMNHRPNLMPFLKKGQQVFIHGDMSIVLRDAAGRSYLNVTVFATELELLGSRQDVPAQVPGVPKPVPQPTPIDYSQVEKPELSDPDYIQHFENA